MKKLVSILIISLMPLIARADVVWGPSPTDRNFNSESVVTAVKNAPIASVIFIVVGIIGVLLIVKHYKKRK